ncbi:MAG: diguanylate cyclase [Rhizobiales bacterium]|nr:diguanylate cyclase [Hyphomicrobiales bacterium]
MIVSLGVGTHVLLTREWETARRGAELETSNLARAFEEHIVGTLTGIDKMLLVLRTSYQRAPHDFKFDTWLDNSFFSNGLTLSYSVIDRDGNLRAVTNGSGSTNGRFSDFEFFTVQKDALKDELFIAKPVNGVKSGTWSIQLSRRLIDKDGTFAGVIAATMDAVALARFYKSVNVGQDGAIGLTGLDTVIRAQAGMKRNVIGRAIPRAAVFDMIKTSPTGSYLTDARTDGVERVGSYRVVRGFPLIVWVGVSQHEVFAAYRDKLRTYIAAATVLTIFVLFVVAISIVQRMRLEKARAAQRASEMHVREKSRQLQITFDNMNQGIIMIDPEQRIAFINRRTIDMLELPERYATERATINELIAYLWERGEFGPDGNALDSNIREFMKGGATDASVTCYDRTRPNGTVIEVRSRVMLDGSIVRTFTDVTERKRNEERIAEMARHDPLTGLANRTLFLERMEYALAHVRRHGEGFALHCLDLNDFKMINDTHGHPAGDTVLRAVADRLRRCVRDTDTVARLGGDEFAIIQSSTVHRADAAILSERILKALVAPVDNLPPSIVIRAAIGIAMAPAAGADADVLMRKADIALYAAKTGEGGEFRFCDVPGQPAPFPADVAPSIQPAPDVENATAIKSTE